jgi:hypothetical protein
MSWFQNRLFCHQLLRFLRLKPYETAFFKVTVPKSDILELPQISTNFSSLRSGGGVAEHLTLAGFYPVFVDIKLR